MKKAAFTLVLALLMLSPVTGAEIAARWMGLGDPVVYRTNAAYRYAPAPDQKLRRRGATVTIGREGLRGSEDWSGPADHRILFVGDSVTWGGTSIDDDKTFADRTCAELEARLGRAFVCGNAGVNGYGTENMIARLRYDPALKRADTVVVTLISVDPIRGTSDLAAAHFFSRGPSGPLRGLWEVAAFGAFQIAGRLRWSAAAYDPSFDLAVARDALRRLYAELLRLEQSGTSVLIVFSPHKDEFYGDPDALDAAVRADLAASGLALLDLTDAVHAEIERGIYLDNVHLNELGHALYGRWIAEAVSPIVVATKTEGNGTQ
jgi:lysophospholipase L1-like esterase